MNHEREKLDKKEYIKINSFCSKENNKKNSKLQNEHVCVGVPSVAQLCLALCDPMDCSLPVFSARGIFQATMLELIDISYSRGYS